MNEYVEQFDITLQEEQVSIEDRSYDRLLLVSVVCLLLFGVVMVYSATSVVPPAPQGIEKQDQWISKFSHLKRHLFSLSVGAVFMYYSSRLNMKKLYVMAYMLLILSLVMMVLVFIPHIGLKINGANRWIRFWPSSFQPSELAKFSMIVFLARYVSMPQFNPHNLLCFVKPFLVMVLFQFLFLLQPDFGSAVTMALLTFTMLFLAGVRTRFLLLTLFLLFPFVVKLLMVPYRLRRVFIFLDPWSDSQGVGYQLVQSFIALGSGGFTGIGLGESNQKLSFLPYINTDFIFSLMGEELGFIGVSAVLLLFGIIFVRGIKIASRKRDSFHYFLGQGVTYLITYQMLINVAVVTGLVPTKGLPLPFISYGGSALFVNMIAVGLLLNLSKRYQPIVEHASPDRESLKRKRAKISVYGRSRYYKRKE